MHLVDVVLWSTVAMYSSGTCYRQRWLSSIRAWRSASVAAGKKPPRHRLETRSPASRITLALAAAPPASVTLSRHGPIHWMPVRTHPSTASRKPQCWVVAWFRLRRVRSAGRGETSVNAGQREH